MDDYIVYIKTDIQGRVIAVNSSAFLDDTADWIQIDSGVGDKYHHAQGNYFALPIYTDDAIPQYKLVDGVAIERTAEEIAADIAEQPAPGPTPEERIVELEDELAATKILLGVE
mgnify:CR=1 FL=1